MQQKYREPWEKSHFMNLSKMSCNSLEHSMHNPQYMYQDIACVHHEHLYNILYFSPFHDMTVQCIIIIVDILTL